MAIDLSRIPARVTAAVSEGNLVPFIGAGLSRQATSVVPFLGAGASPMGAFPTWTELLLELASASQKEGHISAAVSKQIKNLVAKGKTLMAAEAIRADIPADRLESILQDRFGAKGISPGPIHEALFNLQSPLIITTNYDRLLEDAYALHHHKTPEVLTYRDAPLVQRFLQSKNQWEDRPLIFKIHGTISAPESMVLSEMDYRNLLYREPGYRTVLSALFVTKVILMLGFSFADPELSLLLESLRDSLKYRSNPDYIVLPRNAKASVERRRLREDFGLEVIEYDPRPGHPEILELVNYLATFAQPQTSEPKTRVEVSATQEGTRKPTSKKRTKPKDRALNNRVSKPPLSKSNRKKRVGSPTRLPSRSGRK